MPDLTPPIDPLIHQRQQVLDILARRRARNPIILTRRLGIPISARSPGLELMVEFDPGYENDRNWGGLQVDLSLLLQCQVDILTEPTLPPERREMLLNDARPL
jgi:hypothetical protein